MACPKLFTRCALLNSRTARNNWLSNHYHPHHSIHHWGGGSRIKRSLSDYINSISTSSSKLSRKVKDSVLLFEATKGRTGKLISGLGQAGATAAIVFGTGYVLTLYTTGHQNPPSTIPPAATTTTKSGKTSPITLIDLDHNYPVDDHHLVDVETIIRYFEDRKSLSERRKLITYFHMISSLAVAGLTSMLSFRVFKNKTFLIQLGNRPLVTVGVGVVTPFLLSSVVRNLPRTPNSDGKLVPFGMKETGHLLYAGTLGLIAAPLFLLGGQSMTRAFFVTTGAMCGLHGVANKIPSDAMAKIEKPLLLAIDAILISFIATLFLRQNHFAFLPLYRTVMHGGLLVYSIGYVHALKKMDESAKSRFYDSVNAAMSLNMNLLNIFARLAFLLPPYFQVCREHKLVIPEKEKIYPLIDTKSPNSNPRNNSGGGGGTGDDSGSKI